MNQRRLYSLVVAADPTVDVQRDYGASGSDQTTSGTMSAGSTTLELANAVDFENDQGILVCHAGVVSNLPAPSTPTVAIGGGVKGTSTYAYVVVALDGMGGGSPGSAAGSITSGPSTLGGLGPDGSGTGQVLKHANWLAVSLTHVAGANGGYAVYRTQVPPASGLHLGFIGITANLNTPFLDYGQAIKTPPLGIPDSPPTSPFSQSLVTSIRYGAGTTTLTLADPALSSVTGSPVVHDDTNALQNAYNSGSTSIYHPPGSYGVSSALTYAVTDGTLLGAGRSTLLRAQRQAGTLVTVDASGVTVRDLTVVGQQLVNNLTGTSNAPSSADDLTFDHVWGQGALYYGISASQTTAAIFQRLRVQACTMVDCEYGIEVEGNWDGVSILGNFVDFTDYNYAGRAISLHNFYAGSHTYYYPVHWTIADNVVRAGNHTGGFVVQGAGLGSIVGNVLRVSGGIFGMAFYGQGENPNASSLVTVTGNYVESLWVGAGNGFYVDGFVDLTVAANLFRNWGFDLQFVGFGGASEYPDVPQNNVTILNNQFANSFIGPINGSIPLSVQLIGNAGFNPRGIVTAPANPLVSGTVYQNTYGTPITIYQPVFASVSGTSGVVTAALGRTSTLSTVYTEIVSEDTSTTRPSTSVLSVPPGWYYSFATVGAELQSATIFSF